MALSIWEAFLDLFRRGEESSDEDGQFVPSPLDLSVRVGHGGQDDEVARELSETRAHARDLEDGQRKH